MIVELFTSEGCSSCPLADQLLSRLEKEQPAAGVEIIALGEHVDYWNRLGWEDPYSSPQFSRRQMQYAQAFRIEAAYTPQLVIDGRVELLGSDARRAPIAIIAAARTPKAGVELRCWQDPAGAGCSTTPSSAGSP